MHILASTDLDVIIKNHALLRVLPLIERIENRPLTKKCGENTPRSFLVHKMFTGSTFEGDKYIDH